jgi:hypothetical protein
VLLLDISDMLNVCISYFGELCLMAHCHFCDSCLFEEELIIELVYLLLQLFNAESFYC